LKNSTPPPIRTPHLTEEEEARMSLAEIADHVGKQMQESVARYAGNPELLMKEHPRRDFRKK
jgi:hypothetical protein